MNNIAANAYKLKIQIKALEKEHDDLMCQLKKSFNEGVSTFGNYKLTMVERPGAVNYYKLLEEYDIPSGDLDYYRKDPVQVYKLEFTGE